MIHCPMERNTCGPVMFLSDKGNPGGPRPSGMSQFGSHWQECTLYVSVILVSRRSGRGHRPVSVILTQVLMCTLPRETARRGPSTPGVRGESCRTCSLETHQLMLYREKEK